MWRKRKRSSPQSSRVAMKRKVRMHRGLGELQRAPSWGHAVRFKTGRTQKAGNDRNACSLRDGAGQGASQRSFELTAHGCVSQEAFTQCQPSVGDLVWQFRGVGEGQRRPVAAVRASQVDGRIRLSAQVHEDGANTGRCLGSWQYAHNRLAPSRPLRQSLVEPDSQMRCQHRVVKTKSVRTRVAPAPNRLPSGSCHGHPSLGE